MTPFFNGGRARTGLRQLSCAVSLLAVTLAAGPAPAAGRGEGILADARTVLPGEGIRSTVFLFSDGGWSAGDTDLMRDLRARGAAVVGVDTRAFIARMEAAPDACVYALAPIEALAKALQRGDASGAYRQPLLAGRGLGGAMVLSLLAQTPPGTVDGALVTDPAAAIPLAKPLCTEARRDVTPEGARYALSPGALPAPVDLWLTPQAPEAGRAHVAELAAAHPDIVLHTARPPAGAALSAALADTLGAVEADPLGLPLKLLPVPPRHDAMAIVLSGDGGWRDIDKQIGGALAASGVPVAGLDSLRYFWSERTPEETAADLARVIDAYTAAWKVPDVALVGYSFGADVLAAAYNRLPPAAKAKVRQVSLLGLSPRAEWEISVGGWLGQAAEGPETLPEIARIDPALLQCFYGEKEAESPCPALAAKGVEVFRTAGGHHFDGNYRALAADVLAGLDRRSR